jgi:hypothetical protein
LRLDQLPRQFAGRGGLPALAGLPQDDGRRPDAQIQFLRCPP